MSNSVSGTKFSPYNSGRNREFLKRSSDFRDNHPTRNYGSNYSAPAMQVTSDEINFLVYRYLQEAGFVHTAFTFACESMIARTTISKSNIPPGALISFVQKGLQYVSIEETLRQDGRDVPFSEQDKRVLSSSLISDKQDHSNFIDFSLLSPHALRALTRQDPPIILNVPPATAAAALKTKLENESRDSGILSKITTLNRNIPLTRPPNTVPNQPANKRKAPQDISVNPKYNPPLVSYSQSSISVRNHPEQGSKLHALKLKENNMILQMDSSRLEGFLGNESNELKFRQLLDKNSKSNFFTDANKAVNLFMNCISDNFSTRKKKNNNMKMPEHQKISSKIFLSQLILKSYPYYSQKSLNSFDLTNITNKILDNKHFRTKISKKSFITDIDANDKLLNRKKSNVPKRLNESSSINDICEYCDTISPILKRIYVVISFENRSEYTNKMPFTTTKKIKEKQKRCNTKKEFFLDKYLFHHNIGKDYILTNSKPERVLELDKHTSEVYVCAWNPVFTNLIATRSADSSARIWQVRGSRASDGILTCRPLYHGSNLGDHKNEHVTTLDWSSNGQLLATRSYDGVTRVWKRTGKLVHISRGYPGIIFSLKWNTLSNYLSSGSIDKPIVARNVSGKSRFIRQQFNHHFAPALNADCKDDTYIATFSTDRIVNIYCVGSKYLLHNYIGHTDEINAVRWDPSGKMLASCSDDYTTKVWDLSIYEGQPLRDFNNHKQKMYTSKCFYTTLIRSPIGQGPNNFKKPRILATASCDGSVILWDVLNAICSTKLFRHRGSVYSLIFFPSGKYLANGSLYWQLYV